jgi:hypothetical protein
MDEKDKKPTQEDLLKAVADVLDEALTEYDKLTKGDGIEEAQVVSLPPTGGQPEGEGTGAAANAGGAMKPSMSGGEVEAQQTPSRGIEKEDEGLEGILDEEEDEGRDEEDEEGRDKEDEDDDEKLMETYKSVMAKMKKRGLMKKSQKQKPKRLTKSDVEKEIRAKYDTKFESLAKSLKEVSETVKMIAKAPAQRRGLTGYAPLKKSGTEGEGQSLKKSEAVNKLLELKKSGQDIDPLLINRIETNRCGEQDVTKLRALGILGE